MSLYSQLLRVAMNINFNNFLEHAQTKKIKTFFVKNVTKFTYLGKLRTHVVLDLAFLKKLFVHQPR